MCIIIAKPSGIDLPTTEILNTCAQTNRDGIGFAFNKTGEIPIISKGFANVKKLLKMMDTYNVSKEHNLLIHFRLATHGKSDQGNCHPFPLSQSFDDLRMLNCSCEVAIAHNGIFGGMKENKEYSDTMKFISGVIASPEIIDNLDSKAVKELIRGYCGMSSKLAFLKTSGFSLVGEFELDEGIYYSNRNYKSCSYNHNWDKDWCYVHKKYDECEKEAKKEGKTWCHIHKISDFCTWCMDHNCWDECRHQKKQTLFIETNSIISCEYCGTKEDVKFSPFIKANVCIACAMMYARDS